jgi:hypothetical protein
MNLSTLNICEHLLEREIDDIMSHYKLLSAVRKEKAQKLVPLLYASLEEIRQLIQQEKRKELIRFHKKKVEILEDTVELLEGQL